MYELTFPAPYVAPTHTPVEILAMAGFPEGSYRVVAVDHWFWPGYSGGRDYDGEYQPGEPAKAAYVHQADDGVWEIASGGFANPLARGQRGYYQQTVHITAVVVVLAGHAKADEIAAALEAERKQAEAAYHNKVREFFSLLEQQSAHRALPAAFRRRLADLAEFPSLDISHIEAELRREWVAAEVLNAREEAGEILANWGGWLHTSGRNGRACYWVVRPDGTLREADREEYSRSHRRGAHTQWWNLVEPGELALWWAKGSNAGDHEFEVEKLPVGGCTEAQLEMVLQLEAELENEWRGRRGLASGRPSPAVGDGWGLHPAAPAPEPPKSVAEGGEAASADALAALRERWRK